MSKLIFQVKITAIDEFLSLKKKKKHQIFDFIGAQKPLH